MKPNCIAIIVSAICFFLVGSSSICQAQVTSHPQLQQRQTPLKPVQKTMMPDLAVSKVIFTPSTATIHDRIQINVEITNYGNAAAIIPPGKTVWLAAKPNGGSIGPGSNGETIGPGSSFSRSLYLVNAGEMKPGTYRIMVIVDPTKSVRESNETNNQFLCMLTIFETNWRTLLQNAIALSRKLHRYGPVKDLAARIEAELRSSEATMLAAEQLLSRSPISSQAAQSIIQELGARRKKSDDLYSEVSQARLQKQMELNEQMSEEQKTSYETARENIKSAMRILAEHQKRQQNNIQALMRQ